MAAADLRIRDIRARERANDNSTPVTTSSWN
jgi:hypothetical protein